MEKEFGPAGTDLATAGEAERFPVIVIQIDPVSGNRHACTVERFRTI